MKSRKAERTDLKDKNLRLTAPFPSPCLPQKTSTVMERPRRNFCLANSFYALTSGQIFIGRPSFIISPHTHTFKMPFEIFIKHLSFDLESSLDKLAYKRINEGQDLGYGRKKRLANPSFKAAIKNHTKL